MGKHILTVTGNNSEDVTKLVKRLEAAGHEVKRVYNPTMFEPVISDEHHTTYRGREIRRFLG